MTGTAFASEPVAKMGFSHEEMRFMADANAQTALEKPDDLFSPFGFRGVNNNLIKTSTVRPFAEYEEAGYLIFSSGTHFSSGKAKLAMAKDLPANMKLVVYTGSKSMKSARKLKDRYSKMVGDEDRVSIVYTPMPGQDKGFWARDGVPVPVIRDDKTGADPFLTLVDARYYHRYEADEIYGELFNSDLTRHKYYYEGGNFMANSIGECLVVNTNATNKIPDSIFRDHYGCKTLVRLPFVKGIGHADESVKFIDDKTVLTDERSYKPILERYGFDVKMLPRPVRDYETYVNSLMVNGVVYVPIFGQSGDDKALQVYRDLGFSKVIGLNSVRLSNDGLGSLHCITMTYPPVEMSDLMATMGGYILL